VSRGKFRIHAADCESTTAAAAVEPAGETGSTMAVAGPAEVGIVIDSPGLP